MNAIAANTELSTLQASIAQPTSTIRWDSNPQRVLNSNLFITTEAPRIERDLPLVRLSVAQYHAMRDASIFSEDDQIELLEGLFVPQMTKHPPHRLSTRLVRAALEAAVGSDYYVDSREPIILADSEPEPDVVVVRGAPRDYADRHPGVTDVALVVEVADDSLERDRSTKLRVYARASILSTEL